MNCNYLRIKIMCCFDCCLKNVSFLFIRPLYPVLSQKTQQAFVSRLLVILLTQKLSYCSPVALLFAIKLFKMNIKCNCFLWVLNVFFLSHCMFFISLQTFDCVDVMSCLPDWTDVFAIIKKYVHMFPLILFTCACFQSPQLFGWVGQLIAWVSMSILPYWAPPRSPSGLRVRGFALLLQETAPVGLPF